MEDQETQNTAQTIIDQALLTSEPKFLLGKIPFVVVPQSAKIESLEKWLPAPVRRSGTVQLTEPASFIRYVQDYKTESTAIFARGDEKGCSFTAVFNYHGKENGWRDDRAVYSSLTTVEWQRWVGKNGQWMTQRQCAEFLEENVKEIVRPAGAEVLEVVKTLVAKTTVDFTSGVKLENGNVQLAYLEKTEAKAGEKGVLEVPSTFQLGVPLFLGGVRYQVDVRLRYRIEKTELGFKFELVNPHLVINDACGELIQAVAKGTGIEPYVGNIG